LVIYLERSKCSITNIKY